MSGPGLPQLAAGEAARLELGASERIFWRHIRIPVVPLWVTTAVCAAFGWIAVTSGRFVATAGLGPVILIGVAVYARLVPPRYGLRMLGLYEGGLVVVSPGQARGYRWSEIREVSHATIRIGAEDKGDADSTIELVGFDSQRDLRTRLSRHLGVQATEPASPPSALRAAAFALLAFVALSPGLTYAAQQWRSRVTISIPAHSVLPVVESSSAAPLPPAPPPSPTPTLDEVPLSGLQLGEICDGRRQAFTGAAPYSGAGPHPVELSFPSGSWAYSGEMPSGWMSDDVRTVQLVACGATTPGPYVRTCQYSTNGSRTVSVKLYRQDFTFRLFEVRTGNLVTTAEIRGSTQCPGAISYTGQETIYSELTAEQFRKALGKHIA